MDFVGQFSTQSRQNVHDSSVSVEEWATSMFSGHTVEHVRHPSLETQVAQLACGRTPKPSLARSLPTRPKKKPKGQMAEVVAALNSVVLHAPIHVGDVVLHNVCDTGADIVTCRDMA